MDIRVECNARTQFSGTETGKESLEELMMSQRELTISQLDVDTSVAAPLLAPPRVRMSRSVYLSVRLSRN